MNQQTEAVIFDWAGTTIDYGCMAPVQAFIDTFADFGITATAEETRLPMGYAKRDHIAAMLTMPRLAAQFQQRHHRSYTNQDIDKLYQHFEEKLMRTLRQYTSPKPHVLETVQRLRECGIKIGSTTGYNRAMMNVVASEAAAQGYAPDCWFCADDVNGFGRPYPYMLFAAMHRLGVSAVSAVVKIGDTASDIQEGKAAGVYTVGVVEGSSEMGLSESEYNALNAAQQQAQQRRTANAFREYGADAVILHMGELPKILANRTSI
ncbi:phosphonoacetaldehyde hydrolase [Stenoxybacter acetivorans]|uniref:phosphonoacetaldehyde hydrolase n=1 Tax=Stenoxybacter acetivorans TaxID=422441 RepID=UPI00056768A1|nr:phosphonoacetaldehyde hydrolase [Stenoxybacter acetivorans]